VKAKKSRGIGSLGNFGGQLAGQTLTVGDTEMSWTHQPTILYNSSTTGVSNSYDMAGNLNQ
jgi:hypothetical protein